jgi:ribonuclease R
MISELKQTLTKESKIEENYECLLLNQLKEVPQYKILSSMMLRSMRKAVYQRENIGHFGLGSKCYTHFTSPIRRYPDLEVHRLLRTYLYENKINNETIDYYQANLDIIATESSEREQAAVDAEREVMDMKMAEYMESHIGEEFDGVISSVTNFGVFVELENTVEGMIRLDALPQDQYEYFEDRFTLKGYNNKFTIGDKVRVKSVRADILSKEVDFVLV